MRSARDTRFWHPFSNMAEVRGRELVIARGDGVHVFDESGRRYLDSTASLWCANLGHGHPDILAAVTAQLGRLDAYLTFGEFANPPALELCERLAELAPMEDARVMLCSGGGDAADTAAKIARQYWRELGRPTRTHVLGRVGGYHGTHGFGTSVGGIEANRSMFGPLMGGTGLVARDDPEALRAEIDRLGADQVAAFVVEPVQGAGGVHPPAPGYLEAVAEICADNSVLLVVDAVICGFGRLGTWFGIERWPGVEPDLITFAKGVTGGVLPLGGVVASGRIAEPFWEGDGAMVRNGQTYSGHATCCAAAVATLEVLARDGLLERGRELESTLLETVSRALEHPLVGEVRGGMGLLAAVQFTQEALERLPGVDRAVQLAMRERGVLARPIPGALALSPPLTFEDQHFEELGEALLGALRDVDGGARKRTDQPLADGEQPATSPL
jgi:putrescine---pyruvate transaminase